jgi:hypothetical protein
MYLLTAMLLFVVGQGYVTLPNPPTFPGVMISVIVGSEGPSNAIVTELYPSGVTVHMIAVSVPPTVVVAAREGCPMRDGCAVVVRESS